MAKGKKYIDATKRYDREQLFTPAEAVELVKGLGTASFDESIELALRLGVDPRAHQHHGVMEAQVAQPGRVVGHGERVEVDDGKEAVGLVLARHPVPERAEVVPELRVPRGLDARQHSGHGRSWYAPDPRPPTGNLHPCPMRSPPPSSRAPSTSCST